MKHLHRVHRVSVAWLHERLGPAPGRDTVTLEHTNSEDTRADVYTKHFADQDKRAHACQLINVLHPPSVPTGLLPPSAAQRTRAPRTAAAGPAAPRCAARHAPGPGSARARPLRSRVNPRSPGGGAPVTTTATMPGVFSVGSRPAP